MGNLTTFTNRNIANNSLAKFWLLASAFMLWACSSDDKSEPIEQEKQLVFEILQIQSPNSIVVWMNSDMDQATFEAIELPDGWIKNQVRAIEPDDSRFLRSPNEGSDGPLLEQEWFGHQWQQSAVIVETNIAVDGQSLLQGARVAKHQEVEFSSNRNLNLLIAPNGDQYLRVSREEGRSSDTSSVPDTWRTGQYRSSETMTIALPNPTLMIRLDNGDAYQGPISPIPLEQLSDVSFGEVPADDGVVPPLELSLDLCNDPSNLLALQSALMENSAPPSYGQRNPTTMQTLLQAPTEGPIYMVNLIKFSEQAQYSDGRETSLSGREANALYSPIEFLQAIGAQVIFCGEVLAQSGEWDQVAIVEYPCPIAFLAMSVHPNFKARHIHKDAGVEKSIVIASTREEMAPALSKLAEKNEENALALVEVLRFNAQAQYPDTSEEPARTGQEAMALYEDLVAPIEAEFGISTTHEFTAKGVLIGDGSDWDSIRIASVVSEESLAAFNNDADAQVARIHRDAALNLEISELTQLGTGLGTQELTRGSRYCEMIVVEGLPGNLKAQVWGTQGLNDCPQNRVDNLDLEQIAAENNAFLALLNGPRIWMVDSVSGVSNELKLQVFGELLMRRLAEIDLSGAQGTPNEESAYTENTVIRNTSYRFVAGQLIYQLTSPNNDVYVMQSISLMQIPSLTELDLPNLAGLLELPVGWTYTVRELAEDLIMASNGEATVITDSLGNAYQKQN